jgi:hypothetical protein
VQELTSQRHIANSDALRLNVKQEVCLIINNERIHQVPQFVAGDISVGQVSNHVATGKINP